MLWDYFLIFLTGVGVSFISTLFGLGGGIIMVPMLSLILSFSHLESVATSLATIVLVAALNTFNFHRKKVIVWNAVLWIALASSIMAFTSARISTFLPEKALIIIFILFLLWISYRTFLINESTSATEFTKNKKMLSLGIGSLSGLVSGFTGIGGGGITTPLMLVSGIVKNKQAAPTSNAIMIFTALFATISFALNNENESGVYRLGYIHFDAAVLLFFGSVLFSRVGVHLNHKFPLFWRKTILGALLLFICVRLLYVLFAK